MRIHMHLLKRDTSMIRNSLEPAELVDIMNSLSHRNIWCALTAARNARILRWTVLGPTSDWKNRFAEITENAIAAGWSVSRPHRLGYPNFYAERDRTKVFVRFTAAAPRTPVREWLLPLPSPTIRECFS